MQFYCVNRFHIRVQEAARKGGGECTIKRFAELDPIIEDEVTVQKRASPLSTQFIITDVALQGVRLCGPTHVCTHTNTRRYQNCGIIRMFCKFANSDQAVYKWLRQRFRGNRSRGIQTHWSADTQAFVVSGLEKEKHPGAQAAFISATNTHECSLSPVPPSLLQVLNFQRVCNEQHCYRAAACIWLTLNSFHLWDFLELWINKE